MTNKTSHPAFSPKTAVVILLALAVVVFSGILLFRAAVGGNVLDSITSGDFRFDLCGSHEISKIVVYKDGAKTATVKTSSVGDASDCYGVSVMDLNFDGFPDMMIARKRVGEDVLCDAWIWNNATGTFRRTEALTEVVNPTLNETFGCIVSHKTERREAGTDTNGTYYEEAEIYTVYAAFEGDVVEFARYEFVYYTKNDISAYLVYRFDAEDGTLSDFSEDEWLSAEEAEGFSLTDRMAADMEAHRDDYVNAAPVD